MLLTNKICSSYQATRTFSFAYYQILNDLKADLTFYICIHPTQIRGGGLNCIISFVLKRYRFPVKPHGKESVKFFLGFRSYMHVLTPHVYYNQRF